MPAPGRGACAGRQARRPALREPAVCGGDGHTGSEGQLPERPGKEEGWQHLKPAGVTHTSEVGRRDGRTLNTSAPACGNLN